MVYLIAFGVIFLLVALAVIIYISYTHSDHYFANMGTSLYGTADRLPVVKNPGSDRIAVFMVATPEIESYSYYTIAQNRRWAADHGYDFHVYTEKILKDLPINFSKIQYSLDLLDTGKYDHVMYIDADAIVHNMEYDIRHLIKTYMKGTTSILFGEDCFSARDCSKPGRINSGVFIVRNNIVGKNILRLWRNSSRGKCSKFVSIFPNCQLVFTNCVFPIMFWAIGIIPFNLMNGFGDTLLIKHAMAMETTKRISEIKKVYQNDERVRIY